MALVLGRRWLAVLLLLMGALLGIAPSLVPQARRASTAAPLTVYSINVEFSRADPAALANSIRAHDADIVVLVEVSGNP